MTPDEELREKLDQIFTKLQVVDQREDGRVIYSESKPFNNQLDQAISLIIADRHAYKEWLKAQAVDAQWIDERETNEGFVTESLIREEAVPLSIIEQEEKNG